MALLRFLVFCLVIISCTSDSVEEIEDTFEVPDLKAASPFFDVTKLCLQRNIINARSRKIICLICKGFDPSCFSNTTNITTETPTTTTSSENTTSTPKPATTEAPAGE